MAYSVEAKTGVPERDTSRVSRDELPVKQWTAAVSATPARETAPAGRKAKAPQFARAEAAGAAEASNAQKLSPADLAKLEEFKDKGDRYGYWNYMASKFNDGYAKIALSVVTNEGLAGHTANTFMKAEAFERGVKIDSAKNWEIGTDLMAADYKARKDLKEAPDGGLRLPVRTISDYHRAVFKKHELGKDNEAWTAGLLVDPSLKQGDDAGAEAVWKDVLDNGGYKQGVTKNLKWFACGKLGCMSNREIKWFARVDVAGGTYLAGQSESARGVNRINGWDYNEGTGRWSSGGTELPEKDAKALELAAERQFRIEHFGENAVR